MKRNKKYNIYGREFEATVEIKFNSDKGKLFEGESERKAGLTILAAGSANGLAPLPERP